MVIETEGLDMLTHQDIDLHIDAATQYATAYVNDQPIATFQRKRVLDRNSPEWTVFDLNGRILFSSRTGMGMKARLAKLLK
jgi:hypothetical protein